MNPPAHEKAEARLEAYFSATRRSILLHERMLRRCHDSPAQCLVLIHSQLHGVYVCPLALIHLVATTVEVEGREGPHTCSDDSIAAVVFVDLRAAGVPEHWRDITEGVFPWASRLARTAMIIDDG